MKKKWWVGLVTEVNREEYDDFCYIPHSHILATIPVPQANSSSGRNYVLEAADLKQIKLWWEQYCKQ